MGRDPIDGDEWVDPNTGVSYIYSDANGWQVAPCCVTLTDNPNATVSTTVNGQTGPTLIEAPTGPTGSKLVLCVSETGTVEWAVQEDAMNFLGSTGFTGGATGNHETQPGMERAPVNGDEWVDPVSRQSYIYDETNGWELVPCCFVPNPLLSSLFFSNGGNNIGKNGSYVGQGNVSTNWGVVEVIAPSRATLTGLYVAKNGNKAGTATVYVGQTSGVDTALTVAVPAGDNAQVSVLANVDVGLFDRFSVFMEPESGSWNWAAAIVTFSAE